MKKLTLFLCLLLPCLGLSQTLLGLNAPPAPYETTTQQVAVATSVKQIATQIGATAYRMQMPSGWNPGRLDRVAAELVARKARLYVDLNWFPGSKDWVSLFPSPDWAHYNWSDYHCSRPPITAAVASVYSQCQGIEYLGSKVVSLGGLRSQIVVVTCNEPCAAAIGTDGLWHANWQTPQNWDQAYIDLTRACAPIVWYKLGSLFAVSCPSMSGPKAPQQILNWLTFGGQYVSRVALNEYPYQYGWPNKPTVPWITGAAKQMQQAVSQIKFGTALPIIFTETGVAGAPGIVTASDAVAAMNDLLGTFRTLDAQVEAVLWYKPVADSAGQLPTSGGWGVVNPVDGTLIPEAGNLTGIATAQ